MFEGSRGRRIADLDLSQMDDGALAQPHSRGGGVGPARCPPEIIHQES